MARIAYVNGRYQPLTHPAIAVEDRGFQFADGVYEVWAIEAGRLLDEAGHFDRLARSLRELRMASPMGRGPLKAVLAETIRRNRVRDGLVYLQITRGAARRDHVFPRPETRPTLVVTARSISTQSREERASMGIAVITYPDERWKRPDIKTVSLLANVLAKEAARQAGAGEAWLVDDQGFVTEGATSTAWIVTEAGRLVTRQADRAILSGITRATVSRLAEEIQLPFEVRAFTPQDAKAAREAFITSASGFVTPVVRIDGAPIGDGRPGPIAARLRALYRARA